MENKQLKYSDTKVVLNIKEKNTLRRFKTAVRFIDSKECYLSTEFPGDFNKPKAGTKAEITAKTSEGAFKSEVTILETSVSLSEVVFIIKAPQKWVPVEFRKNMRVKVTIPITVKYDDGYTIETITDNISVGGITFEKKDEKIPEKYNNLTAKMTLGLPNGEELTFDTKFLRLDVTNVNLYTHKILVLTTAQELVLSRFIKDLLLIP